MNLDILEPIEDAVEGWKLPHDMCSCSSCGWSGPVKSCCMETDSEGWEYPSYNYHVCPVCELGGEDGEIDCYWSSILEVFEQAAEESRELIKPRKVRVRRKVYE